MIVFLESGLPYLYVVDLTDAQDVSLLEGKNNLAPKATTMASDATRECRSLERLSAEVTMEMAERLLHALRGQIRSAFRAGVLSRIYKTAPISLRYHAP
jgi:hypothetical protein